VCWRFYHRDNQWRIGSYRPVLSRDSILINASNITALEQTGAGNRARVDGGGGVDTLKLDGAGLTLDLTSSSAVSPLITKPRCIPLMLTPR
jgi:hypothetical protein